MAMRPEDQSLARRVLALASTRRRYEALVCPVAMSSGCRPWMGAVGGNGHGRFWICATPDGRDLVMTAHRAGFAIVNGFDALASSAMVRHTCDEPICQNPEHWSLGTSRQNLNEWLARVAIPGSPLRDVRGPLGRAVALRDAARCGADLNAVALCGIPANDQYQDSLF